MFVRFTSVLLAVSVVPVLVAASAVPRTDPSINQCNTGPTECCNSVVQPNNQQVSNVVGLLGSLGVVLGPITGLVGLHCSPILGTGGSCVTQPVCCTNNQFNGLINFGCSPINIIV